VRALVGELGADLNIAALDGTTPLLIAAQNLHCDVVWCLAKEFVIQINEAPHEITRLLMKACIKGKIDFVRIIVTDIGTDVNRANSGGFTPLFAAAEYSFADLVKYLVVHLRADVRMADSSLRPPLIIAAARGHLKVVQCLVALGAGVSLFDNNGHSSTFNAAREGHFDVIRFLVKHGASIHHYDDEGNMDLIRAARGNHAAMCKWLVKAGADPQAAHEMDGTAADISQMVGASLDQIAYLEAKAHCLTPRCSGPGSKKC
jgi:ankyrin repeat protein